MNYFPNRVWEASGFDANNRQLFASREPTLDDHKLRREYLQGFEDRKAERERTGVNWFDVARDAE